MMELAADRYGKAAIRIVRVGRDSTPHRLRDLTVAVALEGDFAAAHTDGDNANVIATDTMKNTAYAFAADHLRGSIETYAGTLARHFLEAPQVTRATVNVREHGWRPIEIDGGPAPDAFVRTGEGTRVATVAATRAPFSRACRSSSPAVARLRPTSAEETIWIAATHVIACPRLCLRPVRLRAGRPLPP